MFPSDYIPWNMSSMENDIIYYDNSTCLIFDSLLIIRLNSFILYSFSLSWMNINTLFLKPMHPFYSIYIHSNCTNEIHIELDQIGIFITTISYYQMGWTDPISSTIQRWSHILEFDSKSLFNWNHEQSNGRGTEFNQWSHFIPIG